MGTSEPVEHVLRSPLPWRDKPVSECGIEHPEHSVTHDELKQRGRQREQKRSGATICAACLDTARRWPAFERDPIGRMSRELQTSGARSCRKRRESLLHAELWALAELVRRHREEFDTLLSGIQGTSNLDEYRRNRGTSRPWGS